MFYHVTLPAQNAGYRSRLLLPTFVVQPFSVLSCLVLVLNYLIRFEISIFCVDCAKQYKMEEGGGMWLKEEGTDSLNDWWID